MPYIKKELRPLLDPHIESLAKAIDGAAKEEKDEGAYAGLLNYSCTRLALMVVKLQFGKISYKVLATVTGVFKNIAYEFYRRLGIPYEDKQIAKSGDVDLYEEFSKEIEGL